MILGLLLVAACSLGGCAYTTVTTEVEKSQPGPKVSSGVGAVMPQVKDQRVWQATHSDQVDPNIRLFAPEITEIMRKELTGEGLFSNLEKPAGPVTQKGLKVLEVNVSAFKWARMGQNEWVVAQLLADGVLLPVYTVVTLFSQGDIDMGGYVFPSTKIGTSFNFTSNYKENGLIVLSRAYAVSLPLGAVSERRLVDSFSDKSRTGAELGKKQGVLAVKLACETMARDPRWKFLPQYRILAVAEEKASDAKGAGLITAARSALPLLQDMEYSPEVAKVLRDGSLTASVRAGIVNDIRARKLGLGGADALPAAQKLDEAEAGKLFNDPTVEVSMVKSELVARSLALSAKALAPQAAPKKAAPAASAAGPMPKPDAMGAIAPAKPTKVKLLEPRHLDKEAAKPEKRAADKIAAPDTAQVKAMRQAFIAELAASLKNKPKVQELLVKQADKAVGPDWKSMLELLKAVDSPTTRAYLAKRES